jgi:Helix-hairpin-helix domain
VAIRRLVGHSAPDFERAFGEAVFDVIEAEPGRLREVEGIGPKRAERIVAGWADQKASARS